MRIKRHLPIILVSLILVLLVVFSNITHFAKAGSFTESTIALFSDASPGFHSVSELPLLVSDLNQIKFQNNGWTVNALQEAGDMNYISYSESNTISALNSANLGYLPMFWTPSNHHAEVPSDMFDMRFAFDHSYPAWNLKPGPNGIKTSYSYDTGEMHIVVLNEYYDGVGETGTDGDIVDANFDWLKSDLRASNKTYKFVVGHEPAYPNQRHIGDSLDKYPENRDRFWNLLKTERVTGYISGHDHFSHITEYDGVYQIDTGILRPHIASGDNFATLTYLHNDTDNKLSIRQVQESLSLGWSFPNITTKTRSDLNKQILVNTSDRAGSVGRYWVDYDNTVATNPDWSLNNNGKWWESSFNDSGWNSGELSVGFDSAGSTVGWKWINTIINSDPNASGQNHVQGIFQRIPFTVYDKNSYNQMILGADYDDSMTVWLNGIKIFESPESPTFDNNNYSNDFNLLAKSIHNSMGDGSTVPVFNGYNLSQYYNNLNEGNNLLVIANWNASLASSDIVGGVQLYLDKNGVFPTPTLAPTPMTNQNNNNNNQSSSNNNEAPRCNKSAPLSAPDLFRISTTKGSAKIVYTPVTDKITGYAVMYGLKKGDERYSAMINSQNNNQGEQSFTINQLNPKTTYYFKVAAFNDCIAGPWSEWIPAKADRKKDIHKYKTVIINKIKTLINQFK